MRKSNPSLAIALFLIAVVNLLLCVMTPRMQPLHMSTSANFWFAATGVDLGATSHHNTAIYDGGDDRFVFGSRYPFITYPDNHYEVISAGSVVPDLPRVESALDKRAALHNEDDWAAAGYQKWSGLGPANRGGIPGLLACIDEAHVQWILKGNSASVSGTQTLVFSEGLKRVARAEGFFWACFAFESLFFSSVIRFFFLPYILKCALRRKLLHAGAMPVILYLPYWFGYCNSANPAYPIGGILYPYLCWPAAILPEVSRWELKLLGKLPPLFSVMTQGRAVTFAEYPELRSIYPNQMGPVNVLICSMVALTLIAIVHLVIHAISNWAMRRRARPSFPVTIDSRMR